MTPGFECEFQQAHPRHRELTTAEAQRTQSYAERTQEIDFSANLCVLCVLCASAVVSWLLHLRRISHLSRSGWPGRTQQARGRDAELGMQAPRHRHRQRALSRQHFIDPVEPPDHRLQIARH